MSYLLGMELKRVMEDMKRKFDKKDIVLCTKLNIGSKLQIDGSGLNLIPYLDDVFFNRRAYISETYKEYMDKTLGVSRDEKDEYEITFLDNGRSLAWVHGRDLVLILKYIGE